MADCYVEVGQTELAKKLLAAITLVDQDAHYHAIAGKVELAEQASESPELKQLQAELEADPENLEIKVSLSVQLHQAHKTDEALKSQYRRKIYSLLY
jgi:putative thioredoxin